MRIVTEINHGTYYGAQQHRKAGEKPCEECRKALDEYQNNYRRGKGQQSSRLYSRARSRALTRLSKAHPEEYRKYYRAEIEKEYKNQ